MLENFGTTGRTTATNETEDTVVPFDPFDSIIPASNWGTLGGSGDVNHTTTSLLQLTSFI